MEHIDDPGYDVVYVLLGTGVLHIARGTLTLCGRDGYNMAHAVGEELPVCQRCERSAEKLPDLG